MESKIEYQQIQLRELEKKLVSLDHKIAVSKIVLVIVSLAMLIICMN
jgi:hypothetical protein